MTGHKLSFMLPTLDDGFELAGSGVFGRLAARSPRCHRVRQPWIFAVLMGYVFATHATKYPLQAPAIVANDLSDTGHLRHREVQLDDLAFIGPELVFGHLLARLPLQPTLDLTSEVTRSGDRARTGTAGRSRRG